MDKQQDRAAAVFDLLPSDEDIDFFLALANKRAGFIDVLKAAVQVPCGCTDPACVALRRAARDVSGLEPVSEATQ